MAKGFIKQADPKRIAHEVVRRRHEERTRQGKPKNITNEQIYDMLQDVQQTQNYLIDLLQKPSR